MNVGYIYIRSNEYWQQYNAVKLGKTINILDRETTYMTSEIKKGYYILVIEIDLDILDYIESQLNKWNLNHMKDCKLNKWKLNHKKELNKCN